MTEGQAPTTDRITAAYTLLQAHPDLTLRDFAARLNCTLPDAAALLDKLVDLSLVTRDERAEELLVPVNPALALHQLIVGEREALEERHRSLQERCELLVTVLSRYPALSAETGAPIPERVEGAGPARQRLDQLTAGATREVLSFMPDVSDPTAVLAPSRSFIVAALERGVTFRRLYAEGPGSDVLILGDARELMAAGAEVRLAPSLPIRLVVVDRRAAAVPADPAVGSAGLLVYHHVSPVSAMVALFEAYWRDGRAVADPDVPQDFTATEISILRMLANGAKDEAVARRLGVSVRTVRRTVADLMARMHAESRFELGVRTARSGLLN